MFAVALDSVFARKGNRGSNPRLSDKTLCKKIGLRGPSGIGGAGSPVPLPSVFTGGSPIQSRAGAAFPMSEQARWAERMVAMLGEAGSFWPPVSPAHFAPQSVDDLLRRNSIPRQRPLFAWFRSGVGVC